MSDKIVTTVRLSKKIHEQLRRASTSLGISQNKIFDEALQDYLEKHNLTDEYQLTVTKESAVLLHLDGKRPPRILEVTERNGVSPTTLADRYESKLGEPVRLVNQEGED